MKPLRLTRMFWLRLSIVLIGLAVSSLGLDAWMNGNLWFTTFDPRFGRFASGPTLMFVFFGLLIVLFGLLSKNWEPISPEEEKRLTRERRKSRGYWKRSR